MAEKSNHIASYRTCFGTDAGKRVLGDLLIRAGHFDTDLKTPEEIAVHNFVNNILRNLGITDVSNVSSYVQKLFELPSKGV